MPRFGMVIDLKKCIGCHTCTIACKLDNGTPPGIFWNLVIDREEGTYPAVRRHFIPRPCMHCDNPPCVDACPSGASYKRADGLVLIEERKCVGCKQCLLACPYGARYISGQKGGYFSSGLIPAEELLYRNRQRGVVEKCNFCADKISRGEKPACVRACPVGARVFGNLSDSDGEAARLISEKKGFRLLADLGTEPAVYYLPLKRGE